MTSPAPVACFERADFGAFTVFVATFVPSGTRFHHAHEDLLSYVVYRDGEELLCDPGIPAYGAGGAGYASAARHNGLHDDDAFAPRPSLLVTTAIAAARLDIERPRADPAKELRMTAAPVVGRAKTLRIAATADGLEIEERVVDGGGGEFFLCAADPAATLEGTSLLVAGARCTIEGIEAPTLDRWQRAREYGERLPCTTLKARAGAHTRLRIRDVR